MNTFYTESGSEISIEHIAEYGEYHIFIDDANPGSMEGYGTWLSDEDFEQLVAWINQQVVHHVKD